MKKISICIPVLNEEDNILNAYKKILTVIKKIENEFDYEFIFTDNNSSDKTEEIITDLCKKDSKVKYIRFRNNLDYDKSILEGYKNSTGDAALVIDCDLQDPPEIILEFIDKWKQGYDLIYGVVNSRKENFLMNFFRKIFYKILNFNSDIKYPLNAHDFRLVDRKVVDSFKQNQNLYPYVRGLTFSHSKNSIGINYDRNLRNKGKSKLGIYTTFTYAINALIEESYFFTKIFRRISLLFVLILLPIFIILSYLNFFNFNFFQTLLIVILVIINSAIAISLEYITRIYFQLKVNTKKILYEKTTNL